MEQLSIFDFTRQPFKIDKPIRLISLFSGYDSQAMALKRLGVNFEHYRAVEFDKYAMASLNAIHGTNFPVTDIRDVHADDLGIIDKDKYCYLVTYSAPCTDISRAGEQKGFEEGSGTRSSMLWEVKRLLQEMKAGGQLPDVLLMENVDSIHDEGNRKLFMKWINTLEDIGYVNYQQDLTAYDFGIPQNRTRTFVVSLLGEYNYKFPREMPLRYCIENFYEDLTEEQALQLVVKSEKAHALLVELNADGKLEKAD